jgi:hypothetical protein
MRGMKRIGSSVLIGVFTAAGLLLALGSQAQQTPPASESSESLDIGGMTLRLGMLQEFVIHGLRELYDLQEIGTRAAAESSWMAETKAGPPYLRVANVSFIGGRLSSVYKYWTVGSESDTEASFASTLYGAITKFEQENMTPCEVATNRSQQEVGELRTLFVTCRGRQKYLSVDITPMVNGKESVSLAEVLQYPSDVMAVLKEIAAAGASGSIAASSSAPTRDEQALLENPADKTLALPADRPTKTNRWFPPDIDRVIPPVAPGVACSLTDVLSKAGKRIQELVGNVDKFTATEFVEHQSVDRSGQLRRAEIRNFSYMVSIAQTPNGNLNVEEYREGGSQADQFPEHIATVGTPTVVLIFHPKHVQNSRMTCEGLGWWNGRPAWQIRFEEHIHNPSPISVVVMGGGAFAVRLKGRAWILADSYQVAHLETDLADAIPEISLRLQHQDIEYRPVHFKEGSEIWLPSTSDLYLDFHGHRFYRRHRFSDFQLFSVKVAQEVGDPKE